MEEKILITSALPYVNNIPHLGNIIGCVLPADVFARYMRKCNKDVLFICGADEYGTTTEVKAREDGVTPRNICDRYLEKHKEIYKWFNINFDYFGRTSHSDPSTKEWLHTKISQDIFSKLANNDYLIEKKDYQLFCKELNTFVSGRFVVGTCPKCYFEEAKGDQCDKCGLVMNGIDLLKPKYKLNPTYDLVKTETEHLYLNLPKLEHNLKEWYNNSKKGWSQSAINITENWFKMGLKERCITRDLKWGTPVPDTKKFGDKYKNKIMYNWFDAPIGYISITANFTKNWEEWWLNPETEYYQFYGIDNVPFHTIIFPASLIGTSDPYTLVSKISSTFYLNYEGGKFSKSRGIGVFGDDAIKSGIESDYWRFYLLLQRPETKDTEFNWNEFQFKINGELNKNLLNLVNRVTSFTKKNFKTVPLLFELQESDNKLIESIEKKVEIYKNLMNDLKLRDALTTILSESHELNKYLTTMEPWKLKKSDNTRCQTVMHILVHCINLISFQIEPFTPTIANKISGLFSKKYNQFDLQLDILTGCDIVKPKNLFKNISDEKIDELRSKFNSN